MSMIGFAGAGRWVSENELSKSMLSELGTRSRINTCRRSRTFRVHRVLGQFCNASAKYTQLRCIHPGTDSILDTLL
jgi:hypothetical protein